MSQESYPFNPFGEPSVDSDDNQYESFPVCFDGDIKPGKSRNTPISRFSETNHSNSKATDMQFDQLTSHITHVVEQGGDRMTKITMTIQQLSKVYALHEAYSNLKCHVQVLEQRNQQMAIQLEKQRVKTNHFQKAFNMIKRQDQNMLKELTQKTERVLELEQRLTEQYQLSEHLSQQFEANKAQNSYLKQLIILANKNYENLQIRYNGLEVEKREIDEKSYEKEKEMNKNIESMKDVLLELMTDLHGNKAKEVLNFNKNHQTGKNNAPNKSNYASNSISFPDKLNSTNPQIHNNTNHPQKQNHKKPSHEINALKSIKSPTNNTNKKQTEQAYRNFFIKTLKNSK